VRVSRTLAFSWTVRVDRLITPIRTYGAHSASLWEARVVADLTPKEMASKLMTSAFERSGPSALVLTDPIADTPMVVSLDQLRPYDHDPRMTRNPAYEDIKASIRERGLDAPPAITRRPGESHYIIRNGGNTRLAILRELWSETKDEKFFRIPCLFRPWPSRGEVVMLTGHLAENELRGGLTFIERALGIEKAREFYELESKTSLSQSELARRLTADGYPVQQSHISRMQDAVKYLLPAIPNVLYGGLGRHQVDRLAVLRRACERVWERCAAGRGLRGDFGSLFHDILTAFDVQGQEFSVRRVQDELVGEMAEQLQVPYDSLLLEIDDGVGRQRALTSEPASTGSASTSPLDSEVSAPRTIRGRPSAPAASAANGVATAPMEAARQVDASPPSPNHVGVPPSDERLQGHIVSQVATTDRLKSIQRLVSSETGEAVSDFAANVLQAVPVQAGGLYPISDVWYIDPALDVPDRLRVHIAQLAHEIADEAGVAGRIVICEEGVGFVCATPSANSEPLFATAVLALLHVLSAANAPLAEQVRLGLGEQLAPLLHGRGSTIPRLSDTGLVKLFRLIRLSRRLVDLQSQRPIDHQERST
jgi:ParB family protein of integrating conjugative element (PFGI_1 class)